MQSADNFSWYVVMRPTLGCNFSCSYCYIAKKNQKLGMRLEIETLKRFLNSLLQTGCKAVNFSWQGGEPTLVGLDYMEKLLSCCNQTLNGQNISTFHCLHTNGVLIDQNWAELFVEHNISVGVSLDGYAEINDRHRVPKNKSKTSSAYNSDLKAIELLYELGVSLEVTSVIVEPERIDVDRLYSFYRSLPVDRINVEPCLLISPKTPSPNGSLWSESYFDFIICLFQYWMDDTEQRPPIQYFYEFENIFIEGIKSKACHMTGSCVNHIMLQPNGDIFPCDQFGDYEEFRIGNVVEDNFGKKILDLSYTHLYTLSTEFKSSCHGCPWFSICHGGCLYQRISEYDHRFEKNYVEQCQRNRFFTTISQMLSLKTTDEPSFT